MLLQIRIIINVLEQVVSKVILSHNELDKTLKYITTDNQHQIFTIGHILTV